MTMKLTITDEQKTECIARHKAGETQKALAAEYGISRTSMCHIINGTARGPRPVGAVHVPAAPILEYVDKRGGIENLSSITGMRETRPDDGRLLVMRSTEERRLIARAKGFLDGARAQGRVQFGAADDFCIEVLGVHPFEVFGPEWFHYLEERVKYDESRRATWDKSDEAELDAA